MALRLDGGSRPFALASLPFSGIPLGTRGRLRTLCLGGAPASYRDHHQSPPPMNASAEPNPLNGLISEDTYAVLIEHDLLSEKGVRDYQIRNQFRSLRRRDVPAYEAIEELREQYPYLQFDTIRKIVYGLRKRK